MTMHLKYRETTLDDLPACLAIIRDAFLYDATLKARLLRLWGDLLTRRCGHSAVIEDEEQPTGRRLVGFGISAFVGDEFLREAKSRSSPHLARHALERWARGSSPFLTFEDIRRANSGDGLNCFVMHIGFSERFQSAEDVVLGWQCLYEAFVQQHRGYRLKELIQEMYGETDLRMVLSMDATLWTDYAEALKSNTSLAQSPDRRPYLIVVRREDAFTPGPSHATAIFIYTPPRFYFTDAEQDLLYRAIQGATDAQLADRLRISLTAVKKRWNTIYERVTTVDPELLAEAAHSTTPAGRRGAEKRRRLLVYLRDHPEELRPATPPKPGPAGRGTSRAALARALGRRPDKLGETGRSRAEPGGRLRASEVGRDRPAL